ncbi:hypothetical protein AB0G64_22805 [Streptomyces longwoodensis]|uniref:hypothetical protein n=1 Tax=Streptomyces longwoodensis TaxID=68231 RepID=UPI0033DCF337
MFLGDFGQGDAGAFQVRIERWSLGGGLDLDTEGLRATVSEKSELVTRAQLAVDDDAELNVGTVGVRVDQEFGGQDARCLRFGDLLDLQDFTVGQTAFSQLAVDCCGGEVTDLDGTALCCGQQQHVQFLGLAARNDHAAIEGADFP